jgi:hypothetical protein
MCHLFKILQHKFLLPALLLLVCLPAQQRQAVHGRVLAGNAGVSEALIVNFTSQAETRTDSLGNFSLKMQVGDLLILSDRSIATKKIRYTQDLLKNNLLLLEATLIAEELEEVVINRSAVTSQSLGIPMGKKYTPAERHLRTAGDFKPIHLLGLLGGSLEVDPILNAINGRTKRLKKELSVEQRKQLLAKLWQNYTKETLQQTYKIPVAYVPGFAYYSIEDSAFSAALEAGNKADADVQLAALSILYLEQITDEK